MKRMIIYLTMLLAAQLVLVFALTFAHQDLAGTKSHELLLNIDSAKIESITLSGGDQTTLTLKKNGEGWMLPQHFSAKVDAAKVEKLLATLTGITRPWPVAKTAAAAERFKVVEQNFERKLVFLSQGKPQKTLLLGSSPGFRKVHARITGEKPIYDIPFSTFQASLKPEDWIDQQQLQIKPADVSAIELPDCQLLRKNGKIELKELTDSEQTDVKQAQKLLKQLTDLQIRDVYGKSDTQLPSPVELKFKLKLKDGSSRDYAFLKGDKSGYELLQVSGFPNLFKIKSGSIKDLQKINRSTLVQAKPAVPAPAPPDNGATATKQKQE